MLPYMPVLWGDIKTKQPVYGACLALISHTILKLQPTKWLPIFFTATFIEDKFRRMKFKGAKFQKMEEVGWEEAKYTWNSPIRMRKPNLEESQLEDLNVKDSNLEGLFLQFFTPMKKLCHLIPFWLRLFMNEDLNLNFLNFSRKSIHTERTLILNSDIFFLRYL